MIEGQILVDGDWREAGGGATIAVVNPSDGAGFAELARGTAEDVDAAVEAARAALDGDWGRMPAFERGRILVRLGQLVLEAGRRSSRGSRRRTSASRSRQARADALALARYFEFYGGAADKVHGTTIPYQSGYTVLTLREPHGVTGHIIPWNYPMQILGRSVGAALAMGNACVLKPGEDASLTALEVGRLALAAGLPPGALNIVPGYGEEAGAALAGASRHRPRLVHRLARGRLPGPAGGGAAQLPGDARARRQVAPARVRRRRPRPGAAVHRQRRDPERRPDLLGGLAPAGRGPRLRRRSSARWPSASTRSTSARPSATSTAGR